MLRRATMDAGYARNDDADDHFLFFFAIHVVIFHFH